MATMTVRTTFALDTTTDSAIQRLAKLWKTSKAEVVRRSVAEAEKTATRKSKPSPLEALNWLEYNGSLTKAKAKKWIAESKKDWEETWNHEARSAKELRFAASKKQKKS